MRAGDSEGGKSGLKIWGHSSDIKSEVIKRCNTRCQQSCCYAGGVCVCVCVREREREREREMTLIYGLQFPAGSGSNAGV